MLQQRKIMVSSGGRTRSALEHEWAMHGINGKIGKGTTKDFHFTNNIPANITDYTAIGRVTARYFILHVITEYGCCANTANVQLHLIVHSTTPAIIQKMQMPPPTQWNPQVLPKMNLLNLAPYHLNPMPQIPFHNMPGQAVIIQPNMQEQYMQEGYNQGYGQGYDQGYNQGQYTLEGYKQE